MHTQAARQVLDLLAAGADKSNALSIVDVIGRTGKSYVSATSPISKAYKLFEDKTPPISRAA